MVYALRAFDLSLKSLFICKVLSPFYALKKKQLRPFVQ